MKLESDDLSGSLRKNEQDYPFRSERVFNVNGGWFFQTRERCDMGPYESRSEAEVASRHFAAINEKAASTEEDTKKH